MSRLGSTGKIRRVLEFLLGLRDDRVLSALATRGFGVNDREQGWELLRGLGMTQLSPFATAGESDFIEGIERWRLEWLRIAQVSLARSHPQACEQLFRGFDKPGTSPILAVAGFLDRLVPFEQARDATSRSVMAKLSARGLTSERLTEARSLIAQMTRPTPVDLVDFETRRDGALKAEEALWAYYLEWSQIARMVIKDHRLLERLGYRGGNAADDEPQEPPAPAGQPVAAVASAKTARSTKRSHSKKAKPTRARKR